MNETLKEAKRLHSLGWAIHWLKPKSKAPVENKWTSGERKSWEELKRSYKPGYNVGVRLGKASKLFDSKGRATYLGVIDCDVKSSSSKHLKEMEKKLASLLSKSVTGTPKDSGSPRKQAEMNGTHLEVLSGRGNGSRHVYVSSTKPLTPMRYSQSPEIISVQMPSVKASRKDTAELSASLLKTGVRKRAAWEISIMGEGQQVVVPPSVHPDSGKPYRWKTGSTHTLSTLPALFTPPLKDATANAATKSETSQTSFCPVQVDLLFDARSIPEDLANLIISGEGCSDRSASLFTVSKQLARLGFSENEILSVLSDRENFLGQCAYDHTQSSSRARAVKWLRRYTTAKGTREVKAEVSQVDDLFDSFEEPEALGAEAAAEQCEKLLNVKMNGEDWQLYIDREGKNGDGPPRVTLRNILLILHHGVSKQLFKRDLFRNRDTYGVKPPWSGEADRLITDTDVNLIREWLAEKYRMEPASPLVFDAIDVLAHRNGFHPVRDYLNGLPAWDGVDRLDTWLSQALSAEGPEEYLAQAFRKWMVAAVTRVFEPGAQFDWMLVLEGNEGVGKSTFFRELCGAEYFRDNLPDLKDKDSAQALDGIWVVELGEVEGYFKANARETFKAYLTRRVDKYRPAYGRKTIEAHRQCVFAGSTNEERFLYGEGENRRVVPVRVGDFGIDFEGNKRWRHQLWAEALAIYRSGMETTLELEGEAKEFAKKTRQEDKRVLTDSDLMQDLLRDWFKEVEEMTEEGKPDLQRFTLLSLFDGPLDKWKFGMRECLWASKALKNLGAEKWGSNGQRFWRISVIKQ